MPSPNGPRYVLDVGWGVAQLILAGVICVPWNPAPLTHLRLAGYGLVLLGAGCAWWTFRHNRPGNFQVRPAVKQGARFITSGPYRHVRHPMYTSILLIMAGLTWLDAAWIDAAALALLGAVFLRKAILEERALRQTWPEYAAYQEKTRGRFFPKVTTS